MAAESNTPVDIEIWIGKIYESCKTINHVLIADRLVRLYLKRLENEGMEYYQRNHIADKFEAMYDCQVEEIKENKQLLKG
jgi:hypothetical protein